MASVSLPDTIRGSAEICAFLALVGIRVNADMISLDVKRGHLVAVKAAHKLVVSRPDLKAWVFHLTGRTWPDWVVYWDSQGRPEDLWTPKQAAKNPVIGYANGLVTLTTPDEYSRELILRDELGRAFVTLDIASARSWPMEVRTGAARASRWKTPTSVDPARLGQDLERGEDTSAIVTALVMRDALLHFVAIPRALFGQLGHERTLAVAPAQSPRWQEVRAYVDRNRPDAIWVAWKDRVELDPKTMADASTDSAATLRAPR